LTGTVFKASSGVIQPENSRQSGKIHQENIRTAQNFNKAIRVPDTTS